MAKIDETIIAWSDEHVAHVLQPLKEARKGGVLDRVKFLKVNRETGGGSEIIGTPEAAMQEGLKQAKARLRILGALTNNASLTTPPETKIRKLDRVLNPLSKTLMAINEVDQSVLVEFLYQSPETEKAIEGIDYLETAILSEIRELEGEDYQEPLAGFDLHRRGRALNSAINILLDFYKAITGRSPGYTKNKHNKTKTGADTITGVSVEYLARALKILGARGSSKGSLANKIDRYKRGEL